MKTTKRMMLKPSESNSQIMVPVQGVVTSTPLTSTSSVYKTTLRTGKTEEQLIKISRSLLSSTHGVQTKKQKLDNILNTLGNKDDESDSIMNVKMMSMMQASERAAEREERREKAEALERERRETRKAAERERRDKFDMLLFSMLNRNDKNK